MSIAKNLHPMWAHQLRGLSQPDGRANDAFIDGLQKPLDEAEEAMYQAKLESFLDTAEGDWLEYWGSWLGLHRLNGWGDDHYRQALKDHVLHGRNTISALRHEIANFLHTNISNVYIYEPYRDMFIWNSSYWNSYKFYPDTYYRYAVIDIQLDAPYNKVVDEIINLFRPAGVMWVITNLVNVLNTDAPIIDMRAKTKGLPFITEYIDYVGMLKRTSDKITPNFSRNWSVDDPFIYNDSLLNGGRKYYAYSRAIDSLVWLGKANADIVPGVNDTQEQSYGKVDHLSTMQATLLSNVDSRGVDFPVNQNNPYPNLVEGSKKFNFPYTVNTGAESTYVDENGDTVKTYVPSYKGHQYAGDPVINTDNYGDYASHWQTRDQLVKNYLSNLQQQGINPEALPDKDPFGNTAYYNTSAWYGVRHKNITKSVTNGNWYTFAINYYIPKEYKGNIIYYNEGATKSGTNVQDLNDHTVHGSIGGSAKPGWHFLVVVDQCNDANRWSPRLEYSLDLPGAFAISNPRYYNLSGLDWGDNPDSNYDDGIGFYKDLKSITKLEANATYLCSIDAKANDPDIQRYFTFRSEGLNPETKHKLTTNWQRYYTVVQTKNTDLNAWDALVAYAWAPEYDQFGVSYKRLKMVKIPSPDNLTPEMINWSPSQKESDRPILFGAVDFYDYFNDNETILNGKTKKDAVLNQIDSYPVKNMTIRIKHDDYQPEKVSVYAYNFDLNIWVNQDDIQVSDQFTTFNFPFISLSPYLNTNGLIFLKIVPTNMSATLTLDYFGFSYGSNEYGVVDCYLPFQDGYGAWVNNQTVPDNAIDTPRADETQTDRTKLISKEGIKTIFSYPVIRLDQMFNLGTVIPNSTLDTCYIDFDFSFDKGLPYGDINLKVSQGSQNFDYRLTDYSNYANSGHITKEIKLNKESTLTLYSAYPGIAKNITVSQKTVAYRDSGQNLLDGSYDAKAITANVPSNTRINLEDGYSYVEIV